MPFASLRTKRPLFNSRRNKSYTPPRGLRKRVSGTDEVTLKLMCNVSRTKQPSSKSVLDVGRLWRSTEREGFEKWRNVVQTRQEQFLQDVSSLDFDFFW